MALVNAFGDIALDSSVQEVKTLVSSIGGPKATKIDEVSTSVSYVGEAEIGALPSQSVWRIKKITESGTVTSIQYANGSNLFNQKWDDRASLTYV